MLLHFLRYIFGKCRQDKEREAEAVKMEIATKAAETKDAIDILNDALRQSAAYRVATAAGRKHA